MREDDKTRCGNQRRADVAAEAAAAAAAAAAVRVLLAAAVRRVSIVDRGSS